MIYVAVTVSLELFFTDIDFSSLFETSYQFRCNPLLTIK